MCTSTEVCRQTSDVSEAVSKKYISSLETSATFIGGLVREKQTLGKQRIYIKTYFLIYPHSLWINVT